MLEKERYEARYLLSAVSAIINQTDIPRSVRSLNWENICKLAEYHKVAHIVYLVTLGVDDEIDQKWKKLFHEKYAESLLSQERYRNAAEMVMWQLKKNKLHALLIKDGIMSTCYEPRELRALTQVRIFVGEGQEAKIHSLMRSMDFQKKENRKIDGDVYYRVPKTTVIFYTDLGFRTKKLRKYFDFPVKVIRQMEGGEYLHQFTEDEFFIYLMCDMVRQYASGDIKISNMVDYWQFYKRYKKQLNWEYIQKELATAGILDFSQRLQKLAQIWFGEIDPALSREYDAELEIYDAMESYILTGGKEGKDISCELTELIKETSTLRARARRKERIQRYRRFTFPDLKYMEKIFPVLEDAPFLMPLCWLWRSVLLTLRPFRKKIHRLVYPIKRRMADIADDIQVRHEEKMLRRMDEAVRQVMEESTSSVGQGVHEILDHEDGESQDGQLGVMDLLSEESIVLQTQNGQERSRRDDSGEASVQEGGSRGGSGELSAQESGNRDGSGEPSVQENSEHSSFLDSPEEEQPGEVYGMQDFFMNSK